MDGEAGASRVGCPVQRVSHAPALPMQVSVTPGALDCWVFLSCLEVLQRIEGCCDRAQMDSNIGHTVGLWSYATAKVVWVRGPLWAEPSGQAEGAVRRRVHWGLLARFWLLSGVARGSHGLKKWSLKYRFTQVSVLQLWFAGRNGTQREACRNAGGFCLSD